MIDSLYLFVIKLLILDKLMIRRGKQITPITVSLEANSFVNTLGIPHHQILAKFQLKTAENNLLKAVRKQRKPQPA